MTTTTLTLETLVEQYLADDNFQGKSRPAVQKKDQSISKYKNHVEGFLIKGLNLEQFREKLKSLHQDIFWGAEGPGFLMEVNKLTNHHAASNPAVEETLRFLLLKLSATTLGERIERCYEWLTEERTRLTQLKKASNEIVSPKSSALLMSLMAFWLDYPHVPYIYYPGLRQGLARLLQAQIIPWPSDIHSTDGGKSVDIFSNADHQAVVRTLDQMKAAVPQLTNSHYDVEDFLYWITKNTTIKHGVLTINPNSVPISDDEPEEEPGNGQDNTNGNGQPTEPQLFFFRTAIEDQPLAAIPEETLEQRIKELRQHILVDESVVRRIYEALLMGHVILTGPPGTGKTELARCIPEILWHDNPAMQSTQEDETESITLPTHSAYTTTLVTATSEWSGRTLIGGIAPRVANNSISYHMEHGHLTHAILHNWDADVEKHHEWKKANRIRVNKTGVFSATSPQEFRGHWLIIDEFNRAPIDVALGDALTTLSSGEALLLTIGGEQVKLPLPKDFRILGTLNSFDRSYLNQISEALKRRFSFVEVPPPSRIMRQNEQSIVLYKALKNLKSIPQLGDAIGTGGEIFAFSWRQIDVEPDDFIYLNENDPFIKTFEVAWDVLEVIRIYRQLGTAQAITLIQRMLVQGIVRSYQSEQQWMEALDTALSDTIADQLQVLLADELDVLLWYLKLDGDSFVAHYNAMLSMLAGKPRRLAAHLEALGSIVDEQGQPYLSEEAIEQLLDTQEPQLPDDMLNRLFHLSTNHPILPHFTRRLRMFKAERGL